MQKYLLFPGTPEQLWKGRFEGTGEWRPFNEIENWMSLSVDTQEKVIQFDRKENSLMKKGIEKISRNQTSSVINFIQPLSNKASVFLWKFRM